ncbi:MAG: lactate racemase domain-containing protein [Clostridia bacterium]
MEKSVYFSEISVQVEGAMKLPRMAKIRQHFHGPRVEHIGEAVKQELSRDGIRQAVKPGERIALTVGSRGIANIAEIIRAVGVQLTAWGAKPFIVPAMGSHGGATAEGQLQVLREYGITEEAMNMPILSSMDVVQIAIIEPGIPIYIDRHAYEADGIIVIGRIKPHTDFKGPIESGLMKMLAIGLGKHKGASTLHAEGFDTFHELVPRAGQALLDNASVRFGLAILENAREETAELVAVPSAEIAATEAVLLARAKSYMPKLPAEQIDVLVVGEIGKDMSGAGMDPNITGRFATAGTVEGAPQVTRIVVLDLTEKTHGNAVGIGFADVTTRRCANKIDLAKTYANSITSTVLAGARIPVVMGSDREAIVTALMCCNRVQPENARIIWIHNTLELHEMYVSEASLDEVLASGSVELVSGPGEWAFDEGGNLV